MSSQLRSDDSPNLEEAAEEEEMLKLEEKVEEMAQKILDHRTTLPSQLTSSISILLESQRPVLPTHLLDEAEPQTRTLPGPDSDASVSQGTEESDEAEKLQLLKQKIASNGAEMPHILNRMKEYMVRIDKLDSSNEILHPALKRKRTS